MFSLYLKSNKQDSLTIQEGYEKNANKVFIQKDDGEGGDFDIEKLLIILNKFYKDNF